MQDMTNEELTGIMVDPFEDNARRFDAREEMDRRHRQQATQRTCRACGASSKLHHAIDLCADIDACNGRVIAGISQSI